MGKELVGRRVTVTCDDDWLKLQVGDYFKDQDGKWWCCPPNVDPMGPITLQRHPTVKWDVKENADGTITVSPSINVQGHWHGFLVNGIFKEC